MTFDPNDIDLPDVIYFVHALDSSFSVDEETGRTIGASLDADENGLIEFHDLAGNKVTFRLSKITVIVRTTHESRMRDAVLVKLMKKEPGLDYEDD